jgi:hypothetical protein
MNKYLWAVVLCIALAAAARAQSPSSAGVAGQSGPGFAPPASSPGNRGPSGPPPNPIFAAIDADGDGVISKRELRKAVAVLRKLDRNQDGDITLEEANAPLAQVGFGGPGTSGGFNGGRSNFGGPAGFPGRDGVEQQQFSQQLLANDRNGDGKLSPDEVPTQLRGSLRGGDTNGDGVIDAQELQLITQRMSERFRGGRQLPPGFNLPPGAGPPKPNGP